MIHTSLPHIYIYNVTIILPYPVLTQPPPLDLSPGGPLPSVLQKVELPIVSNVKCTDMFLEAGYKEHIPDIFLCAGYKEGKQDTCEVGLLWEL